ncbi:2OG-Fe(II) oxygenase family protein [Paraburkholderia sp. C35]|uniref:isopenicillin N synthase family dioxygenase n=1 Tax=Paraburkholderia sp. C35 TaxID=2126993 RepID=UPI000D68C294|nr:2OG-Fe(II) oxygenase family protein [Paraburkholderia sp. C35]
MNIPVVDVSPLLSEEPRAWQRVAQQLQDAHENVGFSVLVNHGVAAEIIRDLFDASKRFHQLSLAEKMAIRYGMHLRGYLPLSTSVLIASTLGSARRPNHSDSFVVLDELDASLRATWSNSAMGGTQTWPAVDGFEQAARRYRHAMVDLGQKLVPCFASMMGLPREALAEYFVRPNPILRLLHYPALPNPEPNLFGSAPHTDYGCLTFVAQDDVGGLQVQSPDGTWSDVPAIEGSLVLNTGQVMAGWSDGKIKATPHRVLNHRERDRYSIAFFFDCGLETPLDIAVPRPSHAGETYGQHLEQILRTNYAFESREAAAGFSMGATQ